MLEGCLAALASFCVDQLAQRGLAGAQTELSLEGGGRSKSWDVAWTHDRKVRLALSLKSMLRNLAGAVPNRIDDLMGEVTNLQLYSPEVVVGYVMVFDTSGDSVRQADGQSWADFLESRLAALSGRRPPAWTIGTIEAGWVIRVDYSAGPVLLTPPATGEAFFDRLATEVIARNPGIPR